MHFHTPIIGGDTNSWTGGLVISVTLLGEVQPPGPVLRSGARPGDWLLVTGPLGGSILGKHLDFMPRLAEAAAVASARAASCHDRHQRRPGRRSGPHLHRKRLRRVLRAEAIPISDAARQLTDGRSPLEHALTDGEDFELLLALDPSDGERLLRTQPIPGITLSHVGECVAEPGLFLEEQGQIRPLPARAFEHELP